MYGTRRSVRRSLPPSHNVFTEGQWVPTGTPQNGLTQIYTYTDALAMASWLNVFVRQADVVDIACIAQSVNVISPLIVRYVRVPLPITSYRDFRAHDACRTSPTDYFCQTIYYPLFLFSNHMRGGTSIRTSVSSPKFTGETLPAWIPTIKGPPSELDVSAVIHRNYSGQNKTKLCLAVVNRSRDRAFKDVPVSVAFEDARDLEVEVCEMYETDLRAVNGWEDKERVGFTTRKERWSEKWTFREHSFTLLVIVY